MKYVNDGETVYLPTRIGVFAKYKVLVAAGNMARIEREEDGHTDWVRVDALISEREVAQHAVNRLVVPEGVEL